MVCPTLLIESIVEACVVFFFFGRKVETECFSGQFGNDLVAVRSSDFRQELLFLSTPSYLNRPGF